MQYTYPCILTPESEAGGFSVSFPDVPEALTCGDCRTEALEKAEDALARRPQLLRRWSQRHPRAE